MAVLATSTWKQLKVERGRVKEPVWANFKKKTLEDVMSDEAVIHWVDYILYERYLKKNPGTDFISTNYQDRVDYIQSKFKQPLR